MSEYYGIWDRNEKHYCQNCGAETFWSSPEDNGTSGWYCEDCDGDDE